MMTLITGGIRSGKSRQALKLAQDRATVKTFLATAEALDEEMKGRIARHRKERGQDFSTMEESIALGRAVRDAARRTDLILIDCLTLWINNLHHYFGENTGRIEEQILDFLGAVQQKPLDMILVTNEVGLGVVPDNPLSRRFLEDLGRLNQEMAAIADEVFFMVSGIPQVIKGAGIDVKMV